MIESLPVAGGGHEGSKIPGGVRNELTRGFDDPQFAMTLSDFLASLSVVGPPV